MQVSGKKRMRSITIIHGSPIKAKKLWVNIKKWGLSNIKLERICRDSSR